MFEAVRSNKRFAQVILAILIIPFAFFGMDAYFTDGPAGNEVAVVGGSRIGMVEFEEALRDQQDRLRESMGGQVDRSLLDSPELRRAVLDNLVNQRVLALHAAENGFVVSADQLQEAIFAVQAFQEDGRFSMERYQALLSAQGMTPAMFEARLGQDIRIQQLALAVGEAAFSATESVRRLLGAQLEERVVRELPFAAERFLDQVKLEADAVQRHYDANPALFERPARVKAEYLVLDQAALVDQVSVGEDELRQAYDGSPERFGVPEERRARHILLDLAADADEARVQAVQAEAAQLVEALRAEPASFEARARELSRDPGSASRGGDLGFFGLGVMVKPFEDAVFAAEQGRVLDPVRSEFGLHIIEVTDIKPAAIRAFEEVRAELEVELKSRKAAQRHAEVAELFANTVYEQPDSLAPAAELLKLPVQTSDWVTRDASGLGLLSSSRLVEALFSEDVLQKRNNSPAIEVGSGVLVSARVVEHEAAQRLPLDEVRGAIEENLRRQEASRLAVAAGEAALESARKGETPAAGWGEALTVQRGAPLLSQAAMDAVFAAPSTTLPAFVGVAQEGRGYALYRIDEVKRPELAADDPRVAALSRQYAQLMAERDFSAYLDVLRQRYKVEVKAAALQPAAAQ